MEENNQTENSTISYNPPVLEKFKKIILDPERADANKRLSDKSYWGDSGYWVVVAIGEIESAINRVPVSPTTDLALWIDEVIAEVSLAHEKFRTDEEDPDGYGSGTFNGALGRMNGIRECHLDNIKEAESKFSIVGFFGNIFTNKSNKEK